MTQELNESPNSLDEKPAIRSQEQLDAGKAEGRLDWIRSRFLWVGPMLLSSLVIGLISLSGRDQDAPDSRLESSILPVETMRAESVASYPVLRTYTGEITARRSSELGFERSGEIVLLAADDGDRVKAETSLATLDTRNLEAQHRELLAQRAQAVALLKELQAGPRSQTIAAARASLRDLSEQLELAQTKRSRRERLYAEGAISREQLDEVAFESSALEARRDQVRNSLEELLAGTRKEQIEAQAAGVEKLNASLANLEIDIAKSTLKAPFAGTVSKRLVDEGTVVSAGQSILRLVESGGVEVRVGVPVPAAARLKPGSKQQVRVGKKTYEARVISRLPELDSSTRTLTVILTLDKSLAAAVAPGQVAKLDLVETMPTAGYWLPITVLVKGTRGLWSCYVTTPSSRSDSDSTFRVERRDVEILHTESDASGKGKALRVLVRGTIQPGDQVIVNGSQRIVPGQLVRPVKL